MGEINIEDFVNLSLKDRVKTILKIENESSHLSTNSKINIGSLANVHYVSEAVREAENLGYLELVGGTPKSGPAYKITEKGNEFLAS